MSIHPAVNPELDLVLDRVIDVPRHLVWDAWTKPDQLPIWFCPKPWSVSTCAIDLRPGGEFSTTMVSPDGGSFQNTGSFLEIVPQERLVWTSALLSDFRPAPQQDMPITGIITLESLGPNRTRYVATVRHRDIAGREQHETMGFAMGWGKALDQLVEHVRSLV